MILEKQNILFFTRTMKLGGTENVILQLCEIFKPLVNKIVVCSCGGVNVQKLQNMGIKHYEIYDIEKKSPAVFFKTIIMLHYIIISENISLIHTHHRMAAFYISLIKFYNKCYFFNTSHNTFTNKVILTRFAYKNANLIACGEMVKKNLLEKFSIPDKQVTVIHNAVKPFNEDIQVDSLINELHANGFFVIGNVGRLSEQKGMEYYIQAIPSIIKKHPEARFLIIGNGEDEDKLKLLVNDIGLNEVIYFTGYRTDIQNLMSQLDLVVLSSLWEGLPLTPIEAFSVGKAVVATAVDGTIEVIENGKDGLLVEKKNYQQLSDCINWIIDHPNERKVMEKAAIEKYISEFSMEKLAAGYINCYKNV